MWVVSCQNTAALLQQKQDTCLHTCMLQQDSAYAIFGGMHAPQVIFDNPALTTKDTTRYMFV